MGSLWKGWSRRRAEELLMDVLSKLRPKFEIMMRWHSNLANQACKRKKQATMHKYLKHRACSSSACAEEAPPTHRAMAQHQ